MSSNVIKNTSGFFFRHLMFLGICLLVLAVGLVAISAKSSQSSSAGVLNATDKAITAAQQKVAMYATTAKYKITLCNLYIQKSRETADTSYYSKCDSLLADALKLEPMNGDIIAAQASVAYGRHDFVKGLDLAQQALVINPNRPVYYGLVGDGQIELGQYPEAAASFQTMVNKRPDLSSFNRVGYIRELYGDIAGAKTALSSAISSGSSFSENTAYSQVELAKLLGRTDLDAATNIYRQALETRADFPPALEGLGKIAFARGDYAGALKYFNQAFDSLPLAQYATDLGDTYATQGNKTKATQQYYLATIAFDKSSTGGVNNDYEKSVFLNDHDMDLQKANALLVKSLSVRPNIFTKDALAWNYYKLKDYTKAQASIESALEIGSTEPIINYHAGMIAAKLGQTDIAKTYLQKAFSQDRYFLESHFSLLDKSIGTNQLNHLQ